MAEQQKTEQPTQHRLQKARREGQFASSKDLVSTVQFAAGILLLMQMGQWLLKALAETMQHLLSEAFRPAELTILEVRQIFWQILASPLLLLLGGGAILVGLTLFVQMASTGFGFAGKNLFPRFDRLQISGKLSRLPAENAFSTARALILLPVFGFLLYKEIGGRLNEITTLSVMALDAGVSAIFQMIRTLLVWMTGVLVALAAIDFVRQRRKHRQQLRMTKQEIRDEMKEMEGNPQMKARIRQIQRERARRQMMKAVRRASVVVVNPTHYAVALYYELNTRTVPTVVAKGQNYLAQKIREKALEHNIPIIENVALAQALYKSTEIGQEIPPHLYRAVAEVLAYIYRTLNRDVPGPR